jgi:DNA polymerase
MIAEARRERMAPHELLRWYIDAGVDEVIGEVPIDRFAKPTERVPSPRQRIPLASPEAAGDAPVERAAADSSSAQLAAAACQSLAELRSALEAYEGCALKRTCQRTVFADGNPQARLMLIGEAPGADEDRLGLPFVGASGKLLDRILASIGLERADVYITNVVPWRPPGNRKPEPAEVQLCLPFIERHIVLVDPAVLVFLGSAPAAALLARPEAISRLRGRWMSYSPSGSARPIPAMPTYHPAYLLRTPLQKRDVWRDFLAVRKRLDDLQSRSDAEANPL